MHHLLALNSPMHGSVEQPRSREREPSVHGSTRGAIRIDFFGRVTSNPVLMPLSLFCIAALAPAQDSAPQPRSAGSPVANEFSQVRRTGTALYRGRLLDYEVVSGMAVHDGDIVLGTAEEVARQSEWSQSKKDRTSLEFIRRDLSAVDERGLWPDGIIPYEIDPGFNEKGLGAIEAAIDEWNSRTVIRLVQRTTEPDFVRFRPEGLTEGEALCRAHAGRKGGEQSIWLRDADGCSVGSTIHEIGHAVGLWHEHQRVDRDRFVSVSDARSYGYLHYAYDATGPAASAYDYRSIMHYGRISTIPPGMRVRGSLLSAGDIDGVARLYGQPPTRTTISTNPPGLELLVDGERITTPASFDWNPGSHHRLEAPVAQTVGAERFLFGRWNDGTERLHTVTASPDRTWFEANYIVQQTLRACADPPTAGEIGMFATVGTAYHTLGTRVEIEAIPRAGNQFVDWRPGRRLGLESGRARREALAASGDASNPAIGALLRSISGHTTFQARYSTEPLFRIESNVEGIGVLVNGEQKRLPWAFPAHYYPNGIQIEAPAVYPEEASRSVDVRHRFRRWSDGGDRKHRVSIPANGGSVRLEFTREYRLRARVSGGDETALSISPGAEDGFYPSGTQVTVSATPRQQEHFAGWTGEVSGPETDSTFAMDAAKTVEAKFTRSQPIRPAEEVDVLLEPTNRNELYTREKGWHVLVPRDASKLTVRFETATAADIDVYVQAGRDVRSEQVADREARFTHTIFKSTGQGTNEEVVIDQESTPRLANDVYYIALGVERSSRRIRGKLSVEIERSGIVRAWPEAFTFATSNTADPDSQSTFLRHETTATVRYMAESNRSWLRSSPSEWVQTGPGLSEISIAASSAGLAAGTHWGELSVVQVSGEGVEARTKHTGIKIPVALVVVPQSRGLSADRRVNRARITSRPANGSTYGAGEEIAVRVDLVDPVKVTGAPTLAIGVGDQIRHVAWTSRGDVDVCGAGRHTTLEFRYAVGSDDRDIDGIDVPSNALALNGGAIIDSTGSQAVLAIAPIVNAAAHAVDGSKATSPVVEHVWISSRPHDGEAYGLHEEISVGLRFSQSVEVTGTPLVSIGVGNRRRGAELSNSRDRTLWFRYTVQADDRDLDGISIAANALSLNGGSIRNLESLAAELDLGSSAILNASAHAVDGSKATPPVVEGVWIWTEPQDGEAYGLREEIGVGLRFSQPVEVTGTPSVSIGVGNRRRGAELSNSRDKTLWFKYTVQADDRDLDGISIPANALSLNGGSIRNLNGLAAELDLSSRAIVNAAAHAVDGSKATPPVVEHVWISSRPHDGEVYGLREEIGVGLRFSQPVEVTGTPLVSIGVGNRRRGAELSNSRDGTLWFRYTVQADDRDLDGISIAANALSLNGGSIRNPEGLAAMLDLGSSAILNATAHTVDGNKATPPVVEVVWIWTEPQDGETYGLREEIGVGLRFSQPVEVSGTPSVLIGVGNSARRAALSSSRDDILFFRYTVQADDRDLDGISIAANALSLNGGSIRNPEGLAAMLDLGSRAIVNAAAHKVDGGG